MNLKSPRFILLLGLLLILIGGFIAWNVQTDGGQIEIKDVRFMGTNGVQMSALLYIPPGVSAETPAPGILAIHGYINSRETQAAYAIEFARRGYVVLALDQTGHGYSDPPAFANGFGGPDGLAYLRSLDIVDKDNIGLEGHSMGGWASLVATAIYPDGYKAINIQGSSTGTFGAPEGTAESPRNIAVTFSTWDEFSELMWGSPTGAGVVNTDKLKTLFGTDEAVVPDQLYGSIEDGTARILYQPVTTHPGDHLNSAAVGTAISWMQQTLVGGNGLDPNNQVWQWNEIGRLAALIGMVISMIGFGGVLLETSYFQSLVQPMPEARPSQGRMRYVGWLLAMFIPVITYFWFFNQFTPLSQTFGLPSALMPQNITTQVVIWAFGSGAILLVLFLIWHFTSNKGASLANYGVTFNVGVILKSLLLAVVVFLFGYMLLYFAGLVFLIDFRFWVVAIKLMESLQFRIFLGYLPFFIVYFVVMLTMLHGQHRVVRSDGSDVGMARAMLANVGLLVVGFIVLLLVQYIPLLAGQTLPFGESLNTIVAFQFVGLLTIVGVMTTYFFRKTGTIFTGAFVSALFITWAIVAAQATHFAF